MPLENCTLQEKPDIARQTSASGNGVSSFLKLWELDSRISGCAENEREGGEGTTTDRSHNPPNVNGRR